MNHYFITGTSRGIGKAIALALLEDPGHHVTGLSRSCSISHPNYTHISIDLSDAEEVKRFRFPALKDPGKIALINNSGTLGGVKYAGEMDAQRVTEAIHVNLLAPVCLTNEFLAAYVSENVTQVIINISSGAGKNPIDGWSVYCTAKAGLDMFSRVVAEEQKLRGRKNVHVFSVAPGIVDTAMQDEIRKSEKKNFSRIGQFSDYKTSGQLAEPALISAKYLTILELPKKFTETVFSVKDV
ncbi:MAG TPA: SDR family NAD(P)-dependent oxidoreductase [Bacteroidia bacterium]|nr:SDR family NAD(P)-dependent oxidoreductase [Bacteroidia bacterium]